jgi:tRNA (guanine37-N1)-methyltransferase
VILHQTRCCNLIPVTYLFLGEKYFESKIDHGK